MLMQKFIGNFRSFFSSFLVYFVVVRRDFFGRSFNFWSLSIVLFWRVFSSLHFKASMTVEQRLQFSLSPHLHIVNYLPLWMKCECLNVHVHDV